MVDTDKLVDTLIEKKKEYCKQFPPKEGLLCRKRDEKGEYAYCPMAYYGEIYNGCILDLNAPVQCRISDFIVYLSQGY